MTVPQLTICHYPALRPSFLSVRRILAIRGQITGGRASGGPLDRVQGPLRNRDTVRNELRIVQPDQQEILAARLGDGGDGRRVRITPAVQESLRMRCANVPPEHADENSAPRRRQLIASFSNVFVTQAKNAGVNYWNDSDAGESPKRAHKCDLKTSLGCGSGGANCRTLGY